MAASADKTDRRVIPRWRSFRLTAALGELGSPLGGFPPKLTNDTSPARVDPSASGESPALDRLETDWRDNQSLAFAADLVGAAIVRGVPQRAREAAEFILNLGSDAPLSAKTMAQAVLVGHSSSIAGTIPTSPKSEALSKTIAKIRTSLREAPRNPALWVDLARIYTLLGQGDPAQRAMRTALALAPNNRFVLRSAARLFLHLREPEKAYGLLRVAEATRHDPWLLAAEIAVASAIDRRPRFVREGERMLARGSSAPFETSELASAIGTLELTEGNLRRARQHFRDALRLPTDNALAQAQWAHDQRLGLSSLTARDLDSQPRSFEARSLALQEKSEWSPALEEAKKWLFDEPFSRFAAASASYLAAVPLERYEEATELARLGLATTPREPLLLNNLTFSLACLGRLDEAEQEFQRIAPTAFESPIYGPALLATKGLLLYRRGYLERGRIHYEQAIEAARKAGDPFRVALASAYHAREALYAGADATDLWKAARVAAGKTKRPEVHVLLRRHDPEAR